MIQHIKIIILILSLFISPLLYGESYIGNNEMKIGDYTLFATSNYAADATNPISDSGTVGFSTLSGSTTLEGFWPMARFDISMGSTTTNTVPYAEIMSFPEVLNAFSSSTTETSDLYTGGSAGNHFGFYMDIRNDQDVDDNFDDIHTFSIVGNEDSNSNMAISIFDRGHVIIGEDYTNLPDRVYTNPGTDDYYGRTENIVPSLFVMGNIDADYYTPVYDSDDDVPEYLKVVRFVEFDRDYERGNWMNGRSIGIQSDATGTYIEFIFYDTVNDLSPTHITFNASSISDAYGSTDIKNFIIDHPTDLDKYLVHAMVEAPENRVYYRGIGILSDGKATIILPSYVKDLVHEDRGVNVQLKAKESSERLAAWSQEGQILRDNFVQVRSENSSSTSTFYWEVSAIRKDVPDLEAEPLKEDINVHGVGPYKWFSPK